MSEKFSACSKIVQTALQQGRQLLTEVEAKNILANLEIPVPKMLLAHNIDEAKHNASQIGYPIALKVVSPDISHKSDVGGVRLNIENEQELEAAYAEMFSKIRSCLPDARIWGVSVQEMAPSGIEVILGAKRDPVWGAVILLGIGGIWVELLRDVTMRLLPISDKDVLEMIGELKGGTLLRGFRGSPPCDISAVVDLVLKVAQLVEKVEEIKEIDLNPVVAYKQGKGLIVLDARMILSLDEKKESDVVPPIVSSSEALEFMLNPRSIAVIGASSDEKKNSGRLFKYIVKHGYRGRLYPVNPNAAEIKGYPCYPTVSAIPDQVDLACLIVPAKLIPEAIQDCVNKGVKAAIVYASGFSETGLKGKKLEEQIVAIARKGGLRIAGPNTVGMVSPIINTYTAFGMALEAERPLTGEIAFITQSGAMGGALLSRAWEQGVGFSRWISSGNEGDLTTPDYIEFLVGDPYTKVITIYMEGLKDGERFKEVAMLAAKAGKPIVVYKTGRSQIGARAVQSHTGALAGDDAVYEAAFKKMGVIRVSAIGDLFDTAIALACQPLTKGSRVGVISSSGGACSVIADECAQADLELVEFTKETEETIAKHIPPFGSARNPVDVTAQVLAQPEMFKNVLQAITNESRVDSIIVMLTTSADPVASVVAKAIVEVAQESKKTILVSRMGAEFLAPRAVPFLIQNKMPVYPTPDRVVRVLRNMVAYSQFLRNYLV